ANCRVPRQLVSLPQRERVAWNIRQLRANCGRVDVGRDDNGIQIRIADLRVPAARDMTADPGLDTAYALITGQHIEQWIRRVWFARIELIRAEPGGMQRETRSRYVPLGSQFDGAVLFRRQTGSSG